MRGGSKDFGMAVKKRAFQMNSEIFIRRVALAIILILNCGIAGCGASGKPPGVGSRARIIQPNYERWAKVTRGMTEAEVDRLLGPPLSKQDPQGATAYGATYGEIRFGPNHFDVPYTFEITYDTRTTRVIQADDPFQGHLSIDGKPTVPQLIYPKPTEEFNHFPRLMDFRWQPSSGEYPMTYEIQIRLNDFAYYDWDRFTFARTNVNEPYFLCSLGGKNSWLWRVRAINRLGTSAWSEERGFKFNG